MCCFDQYLLLVNDINKLTVIAFNLGIGETQIFMFQISQNVLQLRETTFTFLHFLFDTARI